MVAHFLIRNKINLILQGWIYFYRNIEILSLKMLCHFSFILYKNDQNDRRVRNKFKFINFCLFVYSSCKNFPLATILLFYLIDDYDDKSFWLHTIWNAIPSSEDNKIWCILKSLFPEENKDTILQNFLTPEIIYGLHNDVQDSVYVQFPNEGLIR